MKTIAYLRVSTDSQEVQNQRLAILEYARQEGRHVDDFIEAVVSSRRSAKERKIEVLLEHLKSGDTLMVSELSRLGRSVGEIIVTIDTLVKHGVRVIVIKEGLQLNGTQDLQTKVIVTIFALLAEIERELISLRTKEALFAAKAAGKRLGRPKGPGKSKLDGKEDDIRLWLQKGASKTSIAKIAGVDPSTLQHFLRSRGLS
jgi:DNA invertase Pin-like site-specific DNA recombinase